MVSAKLYFELIFGFNWFFVGQTEAHIFVWYLLIYLWHLSMGTFDHQKKTSWSKALLIVGCWFQECTSLVNAATETDEWLSEVFSVWDWCCCQFIDSDELQWCCAWGTALGQKVDVMTGSYISVSLAALGEWKPLMVWDGPDAAFRTFLPSFPHTSGSPLATAFTLLRPVKRTELLFERTLTSTNFFFKSIYWHVDEP